MSYYPKEDRKIAGWLGKIGIMLATIVLDIFLLIGSGFLGGAAIAANNLALGILAIPAVMGMFCYAIGGNKVTDRFLKSLSGYARGLDEDHKFNWKPVIEALKGDGFMVGVALFVMLTLIILMVVVATQFGDLGDESYYALAKIIMIVAIMILMFPLLGAAAKLVGNEKAAAECGYNSIRGGIIFRMHGGKEQGDGSGSSAGGDGHGGMT